MYIVIVAKTVIVHISQQMAYLDFNSIFSFKSLWRPNLDNSMEMHSKCEKGCSLEIKHWVFMVSKDPSMFSHPTHRYGLVNKINVVFATLSHIPPVVFYLQGQLESSTHPAFWTPWKPWTKQRKRRKAKTPAVTLTLTS